MSLGNQIIDFTDDTSITWITAEELSIDREIINEFVRAKLEIIFRDFDGEESVLFSYDGWKYYQRLKEFAK